MKFLPNADAVWERIIVGDYNCWGQKKVLQWSGGCRTRGENVDSMEIAIRSLHSLLVCDRRQVSLSFPLHRWRNLKNQGWQLSWRSTRLEPQAHSISFVFLTVVHIASVRDKSYLPSGFLSPMIWPWPPLQFRQFCCITLVVFASVENLRVSFWPE